MRTDLSISWADFKTYTFREDSYHKQSVCVTQAPNYKSFYLNYITWGSQFSNVIERYEVIFFALPLKTEETN